MGHWGGLLSDGAVDGLLDAKLSAELLCDENLSKVEEEELEEVVSEQVTLIVLAWSDPAAS